MEDLTGRVAHPRRRRWTGVALVIAICVAGLIGSWAASTAVEGAQRRQAGQLMDQRADEVSRAVTAEADRYRDTLSDVAAAASAQSDFSKAGFLQITSKLSRLRLPGAAGVAFVVSTGDIDVTAVQAYWRARGAHGLTLASAGPGQEHMFLVFNRALDGGVTTAGRDLSLAPEPSDALRMSRATGKVTASLTYVLFKDRALPADRQQMSFMLAAPITASLGTPDFGQFRGWIVLSMRGGDFVEEAQRSQSRGVSVTLADLSTSTPTVVSQPTTGTVARAGALSRLRPITVGQRQWQLRLESTESLQATADRRISALTLGIGVLITLLVAAMAGILFGARNRAMDKVDRATAALQDDIRRRTAVEAQLRQREIELHHRALHDPLTELPNRNLFHERVDHAIATHSRGNTTLAVLFIDLDGFKQINDTFGHGTGDAMLIEVAARLRDSTRTGDTVGRFGGDEFAVLTEQIGTLQDATIVADRIVSALQRPFNIDGQTCHVTASAGVAIYRDGDNADTTIRSADKAMYYAKAAGKNHYAVSRI